MEINCILNDTREIAALHLIEGNYVTTQGKYPTCDKIIPYEECGEMGNVIWFASIKNGKVNSRINSKFVVMVVYKDNEPKNQIKRL